MTAAGRLVPEDLRAGGYPRFSDQELQFRREALLTAAADAGASLVLLVGVERSGSAVQWITGWPVTREAFVVIGGDEPDVMFVQHYNHVPLARQLAPQTEVSWGGASTTTAAAEELVRRGARVNPVGVVGPLAAASAATLAGQGISLTPLDRDYTKLRLIKSDEELRWLQVGAALSDAGIDGLRDGLRSGLTEWDLSNLVERAYTPHGGTTHIHYFGVTPMQAPQRPVPAQYPSYRQVGPGDAVTVELSAAFWGYPGQVLRTFAVEAEPPALYRELHDVADAAFDAIVAVIADGTTPDDIIDAGGVIEDAGFTTLDDLVHGFGGGYLPPILGSRSRDHDRSKAIPLRVGMTIVVQPNVVTTDGRAGVQTGELVVVTASGARRLHTAPRGLARVG